MLHLALSPDTIFVDERGRLRLGGVLGSIGTAAAGSPYTAPELGQRAADVDARADVYSLGVLLYEGLTGNLPIGRFPPPSRRARSTPRLDQAILRMIEHDPRRRFSAMTAARGALARSLRKGSLSAGSLRPPVAGWAVTMALLFALIGWWLRDRSAAPAASPLPPTDDSAAAAPRPPTRTKTEPTSPPAGDVAGVPVVAPTTDGPTPERVISKPPISEPPISEPAPSVRPRRAGRLRTDDVPSPSPSAPPDRAPDGRSDDRDLVNPFR